MDTTENLRSAIKCLSKKTNRLNLYINLSGEVYDIDLRRVQSELEDIKTLVSDVESIFSRS